MNTKQQVSAILIFVLALSLATLGCGLGQQLFGPTITPSPTVTPSPTITPTATLTPAPTSTPLPTMTPTATTGSIKGTVLMADGKPLPNCSLVLVDEAETSVANTKTDAQGQYSFTEVKPGTYTIQYTAVVLDKAGKIVSITIANTKKFEVKAGEVVQVDIEVQ